MGKWVRDISVDDFLFWANNPSNREDLEFLFDEGILGILEEAEGEDFFGTEGFDKRFGG